MLIMGHRGAAGLEPENTLRSIEKSIELGVDMIEVDIQRCASGETVLFHDTTAKRLLGIDKKISEMSLEELKDYKVKGERIPTLQEAINLIDGRKPLNLELKDRASVKEVARIIKENNLRKTLVTSYDRVAIKLIRDYLPALRIGAVAMGLNPFLAGWLGRNKAYSVSLMYPFVRKALVNRCKRAGVKVYVYPYGPKMKMEMGALERIGADGAFFNYPGKKPF